MNRKAIGFLLAASVLGTMSFHPALAAEPEANDQVAMRMGELSDVPRDHWAYAAVKLLVEDLEIMEPKTGAFFQGDDLMTRYELAQLFHKLIQKLEARSGQSFDRISNIPAIDMVDLKPHEARVAHAIVNRYGIMQTLPGKRFMGDLPIDRYEIAFELHNYFILIESQNKKPALARRDRANEMRDLLDDHWATKAVEEIIDSYQIMDGYPDRTFRGDRQLTRFETAATLREFLGFVDAYYVPLISDPLPEPTPEPTTEPTALPTPVPTVSPVAPQAPSVDLRLGGNLKFAGDAAGNVGPLLGPQINLDGYFLNLGTTRLGLELHGDWMFYDPLSQSGRFTLDLGNGDKTLASRLTAGGGLLWRILGAQDPRELSLTMGLGYDSVQFIGSELFSLNHGVRGRVDLEIPINAYLSLVARNAYTHFLGQQIAGVSNANQQLEWKNDAFIGVNIPAYGVFSFELGYKDTRYMLQGALAGDIGAEANLRLRF